MHLSRWFHRAAVVVLAAASATVGTVSPAAAMPSWDDHIQGTFGYSWELAHTGVMATHTLGPEGTPIPGDFFWAPSLYPGGQACFELSTVHEHDGEIYLSPHDWCDNGTWQPGQLIDAAFRDKYVRTDAYTVKIELTDPATNTWTGSLLNRNTGGWDFLYSKGGVHDGSSNAGWDYYEIFTYYGQASGVGNYCDRTAGSTISTRSLYFKVNGTWVSRSAPDVIDIGSSDPDDYGCPGLTMTRGANTSWTVTNAPLGCTVHPVLTNWGGSNFALIVQLSNPNAYNIKGWSLGIELNGTQTVTGAISSSVGHSQSGDTVTVTNGSGNGAIASGGTVSFTLTGTYTGTGTTPTSFTFSNAYTSGACTVV